ncbi:purple acid phosphatase [Anaeramoeba flamelloides]|uniref:Purple acid phosphatase n=1 Tax=Anaeramoeba flamelloides TaxID=1746091 RepID=A0AAV8A8F7_9EUKA|nr:purple acid phosphatase [Anaeramoeba flamelloides]|eukprot:Anaeramoba_flamelloidesa568566_81.p1 GENE.a568566_81~~a568566_81.p1  ORF type:complete len:625 (-),score=108.27 a568566_81:66-1940(-)
MLFPKYNLLDNVFIVNLIAFCLFFLISIVFKLVWKEKVTISARRAFSKSNKRRINVPYFFLVLLSNLFLFFIFLTLSAGDHGSPYGTAFVVLFFLFIYFVFLFQADKQQNESKTDGVKMNNLDTSSKKDSSANNSTTSSTSDDPEQKDAKTDTPKKKKKQANLFYTLVLEFIENVKNLKKNQPIILISIIFGSIFCSFFPLIMIENACYDPFDSGFTSTKVTRRYMESSCKTGKPCHVYLTVSDDLRTKIIVIFHTNTPFDEKPSVKYGEVNDDGYPNQVQGESYEIKYDRERYIHYVSIINLLPGTEYKFIAGEYGETDNWSDEKKFRTTHNSTSDGDIKFVVGADTNVVEETNIMTKMMATFDPDFAAIGGDIALTNGNPYCYRKWDKWLSNWEEFAINNNRLIPILPVIGNHEVKTGYRVTDEPKTTYAPFYFPFFQKNSEIKKDPFDQKSYQINRISDEIAFAALDSHHIYTEEEQTSFINEEFPKLQDDGVEYLLPIYHIPAYPSDKEYSVEKSTRVRTAWAELFDKHNIKFVFEGHSHMLKKTKPLRGGKVAEDGNGIIFMGDGAWGRLRDRRDLSVKRWYEDVVKSKQHVWIVNINDTGMKAEARGDEGEVLTSVTS